MVDSVSVERMNFSHSGVDMVKKMDFADDPVDAWRSTKVEDAMRYAWSL